MSAAIDPTVRDLADRYTQLYPSEVARRLGVLPEGANVEAIDGES